MPRDVQSYDLATVATSLDDDLDALAAAIDAGEAGDGAAERAVRLEHQLAGVQWALDEFGDGADADDAGPGPAVTLGALTAGEYARVRDEVATQRDLLVGSEQTETDAAGARQLAFVAAGVVDGPFIDESTPTRLVGFDERRDAVAALAPQFVSWLEDAIDDLTTPDVDAGNFAARLGDSAADPVTTSRSSGPR